MNRIPEILLVDENQTHAKKSATLLVHCGYHVHTASGAKSALRILAKTSIDLILLDTELKGISGFCFCAQLKADDSLQDIPIMFITAEKDADSIKQGFHLGCCDYLCEPFVEEEYLARIETHLRISTQNRALSESYQELDLFCSAVAHDLKGPLNVIRLLIEALQNELYPANGEVEKITAMIAEKSDHTVLMIERLLEFSKLCGIEPKKQAVCLDVLFHKALEQHKVLWPNRTITLVADPLPTIQGDEVLIERVLQNAISNALKFSSLKQETVLTVRSTTLPDYHLLSIKDNGVGFDMQYADHLFQIFQRLHPGQFEGSGVGLALIARIMKRQGGKVELLGKPHQGAELRLYFKRKQQKEEASI